MGKEAKYRCWILPSMDCGVESDEIPLEVCKLCIEKRLKVVRRSKTIKHYIEVKADAGKRNLY